MIGVVIPPSGHEYASLRSLRMVVVNGSVPIALWCTVPKLISSGLLLLIVHVDGVRPKLFAAEYVSMSRVFVRL